MAMPSDLVLIRHGESEANIVQKVFKADANATAPEGFFDRHDSRMRLSELGVQQAQTTGRFILESFPEGFDRYYVSALTRTLETAGSLAINGNWNIDDRWRERDWGEYNCLNDAEREEKIPHSKRIKNQAKWYWCPPGGESLATGVRLRFTSILDTLHREMSEKRVLAVTHGETIGVARFVLERMTPEQWMEQEKDPNYKIVNTMVMHYSRRNPNTGDLDKRIAWRRAICPWDTTKSWNDGQWVYLPKSKYTDEQLLEMAHAHDRLFDT